MTTPKTRLLIWRDEIAAELETAKNAVPPLVAAHDAAIGVARELLEDYRELQHFLDARLPVIFLSGAKAPLEGPLRIRSEALRAEIEPAKTRQARALADLEAARSQVAELQRALVQIDLLIPVEETAETI